MASKEVEYHQAKPKRTGIAGQWDGFSSFMWDPVNKRFLGRGCKSWAQIGLFYLIYYGCLAAFFAVALQVFFTTLDDVEPRQTGMQSILKGNPGMGFRPRPKVENTLVHFQQGEPDTYTDYTKHIQDLIDGYNNTHPNRVNCKEQDPKEGEACEFDPLIEAGPCTPDLDFGYHEGKPCIALKLNRIYGWVPEAFDNQTINEDNDHAKKAKAALGDLVNPDYIGVTCEGENQGDQDNRGPVRLYPKYGFPIKGYLPFMNQKGYQTPLVFAQFEKLETGVVVQLWCKAWAKNIYHHKNDKAGSIHLEIFMD